MAKTVLIVEDNVDMRDLEKKIIVSMGYDVIEAGDAKDAIRLSCEKLPDLIVMDVRLPSKKRGIGAAKNIRDNESTTHIPIVFVTAYEQGEETEEIHTIENHSYITKPFTIETFRNEIKKYLE